MQILCEKSDNKKKTTSSSLNGVRILYHEIPIKLKYDRKDYYVIIKALFAVEGITRHPIGRGKNTRHLIS